MFLKKENMKTMIGTDDREFKRSIINIMNSIAFGAEKMSAKTIDNIQQQTAADKSIVNIVISGKELLRTDFDKNIARLVDIAKNPHTMILLVLEPKQVTLYDSQAIKPENIVVTNQPGKLEFSKVFHNRAKGSASAKKPNPQQQKPDQPTKRPAQPAKNLLALESSGHVKATIAWLNDISNDHQDLEKVRLIGQRFNGFVGGMAFMGHKPGWYQLRNLALLVDDLCRIYDEGCAATKIIEEHLFLLVDAARCSFFILRDLRDNKQVEQKYLNMTDEIIKRGHNQSILKDRNEDQSEVDHIFDDISATC